MFVHPALEGCVAIASYIMRDVIKPSGLKEMFQIRQRPGFFCSVSGNAAESARE